MGTTRFDSLTKQLGTGATRRRAIAGLGALALAGAGVIGVTQDTSADKRRNCIERCVDHGGDGVSLRKLRQRCRRRCENR